MDRAAYLTLATLLLCAGCDLPKTWSEKELRQIAREEAELQDRDIYSTISHNADVANRRAQRIEELESKVRSLESEVEYLRAADLRR